MMDYSKDDLTSFYLEGNYAMACLIARQDVEEHPGSGELYVVLARMEMMAYDDIAKAETLLKKARRLGLYRECRGLYHSVHGELMFRNGQLKKAIKDYTRSIKAEETEDDLDMLGQALSAVEDKRAERVWRRVLEMNPKNRLAYILLAYEVGKRGDVDESLNLVRQAEQLDCSCPGEDYHMGVVYHQLDKYRRAVELYMRADRGGYEAKGELYAAIGSCYLSLGEHDKALQFAKQAVAFEPDNSFAKEVLDACMKHDAESSEG